MQHQKIRPSYADLQRLEGDFPSDEETSDDGIPEYAPAATPYRKEPPVVVSTGTSRLSQESSKSLKGANTGPLASSRSFAGKKEVRIAPNAQNEVYEIEGRARFQHARQHRANLSKPQAPNVEAIGSNGQSSVLLPQSAPLLGTVQERNGILQPSQTSTNKKSSRFASARQRDKDNLQSSSSQTYSNRGSQSNCEEVWLDEEGQPMSAFRRKRLIDQGKTPPSNASRDIKRNEVTSDTAAVAPDDNISKHNADRIAAMSPEEIEESLQQLKDAFGADTLEKLKSRKMRSRAVGAVPIKASGISPSASQEPRQYADVNDSEAIRSKYFPEEPAELPKSLQWTKEVEKGEEARFGEASFRFNFSGALMEDNDGDMSSKAYLEGLHHHGQEQDRAGYTTEELHHLARSTLSSQSILALQTLERIVLTYPEHGSNRLHDANKSVSEYLKQHNIRGKTAVIASWYLENRQAGLRHAAIRCLRACFISTLAGPEPPLGLMVTSPLPARGESSTRIPYDIYSEELALGLVPSLCNSLSQTTQSPVDRDLYLNTLTFLSKRSIKVCDMILKRSLDISIIVRDCITARSWPPTKSDRPISESLVLLLCLISSSRANATLLVDQGYIEPLLRFLALPPWKIGKDIVIEADWTSFGTTMQIYEALASYGLYTHVVKTAYSLLPSLQAWIGQSRYRSSSELMALSSSLKCLNTWIVCAVQGGLDIDWNQILEWYECAFDCARESLNLGIEFINTLSYISVAADSVELLYNWISCARKYNQSRDEELKRLCSMAERIGDEILSVLWEEMSKNLCTEAAPDLEFDAVRLKQLSLLCKSALKIIYCQGQRDNKLDDLPDHAVDAARKVILDPIWQSLDSEGARQAGSELYRQYITAFCHHVLQSCKSVGLSDTLTLLRLSRAGQEDKVMELIEDVLPKVYCDVHSHDLATLRPFIVELIRPEKKVQVGRPLFITAESLSQTMTLFFNAPVDSTNQDNSDNVDPLSGAPLWKAACSGLPIRADWTFCALDDLLHSGNCASLNRKDALSSDWDANERQIVISTLRLSTTLWKAVIEDGVDCARSIFPSAAEAHLAIIKVFMLEEEQDQSTRASGLITGKDLFRDVEVQTLLEDLYSLAKQLPSRKDDMEKVAQRQYGSSLPFYQLFTSLFGLYDSISFAMELFGRAVMLAQSREYAADYRRLLWVDYAHCLPTFQTSLEQNPLTDLDQYLVVDLAKEDDIIQSMINALLTGSITKSKNELLWSIAIQQIGYTLWYSSLALDLKEKIARSLYRRNISKAKEIQSSILAYTREPADLTSRDNSRLDWLEGLSLNVSDAVQ